MARGIFGRGSESTPGDPPRLEFVRQRPGANEPVVALQNPKLSRRQWLLTPSAGGVQIENLGRRAMLVNGLAQREATAREGDTLAVEGVLLGLLELRPRLLPRRSHEEFRFGTADPDAIIGESAAAWSFRNDLANLARGDAHCVILGESGSGKELSARAIHRQSARGRQPFVARNAATIPESLVEAELFGNVANYPNPGTPARQGLVGMADGSTLFLDEIAELSAAQQANLLRVLDSGEYQRLGEDRPRTSRFRMIAATNRPLETMNHDFVARFGERLHVPGLLERRADIPFLLSAVLDTLGGGVRVHPELLDQLVRHGYTHHFRELERLVRLAKRAASGGTLELTAELRAAIDLPVAAASAPSESEIREALTNSPSTAVAAKRLGLPSRFALYRLMRKLGIQG